MIDFASSIIINPEEKSSLLEIFGRIDEQKREIVIHYELKSIGVARLEHHDFVRLLNTFLVTSTDAKTYVVYGCQIVKRTERFSYSFMGTIEGVFNSLIQQPPRGITFKKLSFSFQGISSIFPLLEIDVSVDKSKNFAVVTEPQEETNETIINEDIKGQVKSEFQGFPHSNITELHVAQSKIIELTFVSEKTIDELMQLLWIIKHYIEFLLSQEIRLTAVQLFGESPNDTATVIADSILVTNTPIRDINAKAYPFTSEDFFVGLRGWLGKYGKYERAIGIWLKTIYNAQVFPEDIYIWKCQAFELFCELTEEIINDAQAHKAPDQSYPNIRNYLISSSSLYGIVSDVAENHAECFMDAKNVRNEFTHHNPSKPVTEIQIKNSFKLMNCCLPSLMSKVIGFKCKLPSLILIHTTKKE